MTPLITVTPRLEQEVGADIVDRQNPSRGKGVTSYGNGKGLELIPLDKFEVVLEFRKHQFFSLEIPLADSGVGSLDSSTDFFAASAASSSRAA